MASSFQGLKITRHKIEINRNKHFQEMRCPDLLISPDRSQAFQNCRDIIKQEEEVMMIADAGIMLMMVDDAEDAGRTRRC